MAQATGKYLSAGTRVKVTAAGPVPAWSTWDDDKQRTSTPVKKRLQELFFKGDKRILAEIIYIANESERLRLRDENRVKVQLRDSAGACIVITADSENLRVA
jgi:hypothetical protein